MKYGIGLLVLLWWSSTRAADFVFESQAGVQGPYLLNYDWDTSDSFVVSRPPKEEVRDRIRKSRNMSEGSTSVFFREGEWILSGKFALPASAYKSIQVFSENIFVGLTHEGQLDFITMDENENLSAESPLKSKKILGIFGPAGKEAKLVDFAVPKEGHLYFLFQENGEKGRTTFSMARSQYRRHEYIKDIERQRPLDFAIRGLRPLLPSKTKLESAFNAEIYANLKPKNIPDGELSLTKVWISKEGPHGSVLNRLYSPGAEGEKASEWLFGSPAVREHVLGLSGESAGKATQLALKKERALREFIADLSESGVHMPDLSLNDIVWNGENWVAKRKPPSDLKVISDRDALQKNM